MLSLLLVPLSLSFSPNSPLTLPSGLTFSEFYCIPSTMCPVQGHRLRGGQWLKRVQCLDWEAGITKDKFSLPLRAELRVKQDLSEVLYFAKLEINTKHSGLIQQTLFLMFLWVG